MGRTQIAILLATAGLIILLGQWPNMAAHLAAGDAGRTTRVVQWSNSGSPEHERSLARDFEALHPHVRVELNFAQTDILSDTMFVSFLSGSPPDLLSVSQSDMRELIAAGMIRPLDDILEQQLREQPDFLERRVDRGASLYYFRVDRNDQYLREADRYPREAARLLHMHGKAVGFRDTGGFSTLTYNKRIFREAAAMFPDEGLLDPATGEPVPPATWSELRRVARVITEYGRITEERARAAGQTFVRPYGLVVQGKTGDDLWRRTLLQLAGVAGSRGFDFRGDNWIEGLDRPVGRFDFDGPAILGALKFLLTLQADGSILPGTGTREYEEVRVQVALGRAAMVVDGWHAALIGAERVPWSRLDIGSAPVPVPDEAIEEQLDMKLGRGAAAIDSGGSTSTISSFVQDPRAAWDWYHFSSSPQAQARNLARGAMPGTFEAADQLLREDPPRFPFQRQAWIILSQKSQFWPEAPRRQPVQVGSIEQIVHAAFSEQLTPEQIDQRITAAAAQLTRFNDAQNQLLAQRIARGEESPESFSFPDFSPADPARAYNRQRTAALDPAVTARVNELLAALPEDYRLEPPPYAPTLSPAVLLLIPATVLLIAIIGFYASYRAARRHGTTLARHLRHIARARPAYLLITPCVLMLVCFTFYPALYQFYLAMCSGNGIGPLRYIGWENYRQLATDQNFWTIVLPNTFAYMLGVTAGQLLFGLLLANLLANSLPGIAAIRTLFFIPLATSLAVVGVVFIGLLGGADSLLNLLLARAGLLTPDSTPIDYLGTPGYDLAAVIFVGIWHGLPYSIILLLAGFQSVPAELYEAARVDGAGAWNRFRHVTWPILLPLLAIITFNNLMAASQAFSVIYVMTGGGKGYSSEVVSTYIFRWGFTKKPDITPDVGYASALGVVYALILSVLVFSNVYFLAKRWRARLEPAPQVPKPIGTAASPAAGGHA